MHVGEGSVLVTVQGREDVRVTLDMAGTARGHLKKGEEGRMSKGESIDIWKNEMGGGRLWCVVGIEKG